MGFFDFLRGPEKPPAVRAAASLPLDMETVQLIRAGNKIEAIALYCKRTGADPTEAKEAIDSWQEGPV